MLTLVVKEKTTIVEVYMNIDTVTVMKANPVLAPHIGPKTIRLTRRPIPYVVVYDDTKPPEPVIYIDAGFYNEEGDFVEAGFYNTTTWTATWDGGYA
jgi:hypothetical protein